MRSSERGTGSRSRRAFSLGAGMLLLLASTAAMITAGTSSASVRPAAKAAAAKCGTSVRVGPTNPNGVYKTLPPALKAIYASYPGDLVKSYWATHKVKAKPPWKIGFIAFAITNQYNEDVLLGLQKWFKAAKAQGLVKGSLITDIPDSLANSSAAEQISAIQRMVREGVNAIIILPWDSVAETPAMVAAGKAGVPVILADTPPATDTPYTVAAWSQNQVQADAGALGIIKKGNIVLVKGIAGNENDVVLADQAIADLKDCPNIKIAATLYGNWDEGTAKNVVSEYLSAHIGQTVAGAVQDGGMMAGVIEAFQSLGLKVPTIADGECYAGDLSWWLSHKSSYHTVGGCFNGFQGSYTYMNVALRTLDNKGPKFNVLEMPTFAINNNNIAKYATPGLPLTSLKEVGGPVNAWCGDTCLNKYFNARGAVAPLK
jgi:ribose transport system substrate-binding protein